MAEEKKYEYVLPKGTVLRSSEGEYTIKRVLGQGGFGITYEARGRRHGDNVSHKYALKEFFIKGQCWRDEGSAAMKYSPAARSEVKECLRDFKDEAIRLNKICLGNRNIVNVNEVFEANGTAYYVMEYLEGGSLRDKVLKNGGALAEGVASSYIRPVAEAVEYIHSKYGLLHCDIKPDNVMFRLDEDGQPTEPVLIDFGISVHFNNKGEVTTTHNSLGVSPGYSPQEQYQRLDTLLMSRSKRQADGFTNTSPIPFEMDVYALGATLYYMLVGENPYDAFSINSDIISKKMPDTISEKTRNVILGAMKSSATDRTQTAREFLKGFEDRYYLPAGFVLRSPNAVYSIVGGVQEETNNYLRYYAVLYTGQRTVPSGTGNTTIAKRYDVYEFFEKGYSQRMSDDSVQNIDPSSTRIIPYTSTQREPYVPTRTSFLHKCREWTGLSAYEDYTMSNGCVTSEIFKANGTVYAVVRLGWKPESPIVRWMRELIVKIRRSGGTVARGTAIVAGVAVLGYGGYLGYNAIGQQLEARRMEKAQLEKQIQSSISKANAIIETDTVQARKYAEWVLAQDCDNKDAQAILAKIAEMNKVAESSVPVADNPSASPAENTPSTVAIDNTVKQEETVKQKEEERKRQEAEKKKQEEAKKKQEQQQNAEAAKKAEQAEAARKAIQYVNGERTYENHQKAYQWALKADPATKTKVIQRLKDMDFPIP